MGKNSPHRLRKFVDGVEVEVTPLDELERTLWWADENNPVERTPPTPDGKFAVFPRVKHHPPGSQAEKDQARRWEESALRMHANQVPVVLEPKPKINELQARKDLERGD